MMYQCACERAALGGARPLPRHQCPIPNLSIPDVPEDAMRFLTLDPNLSRVFDAVMTEQNLTLDDDLLVRTHAHPRVRVES
jgi:hypothetical protein